MTRWVATPAHTSTTRRDSSAGSDIEAFKSAARIFFGECGIECGPHKLNRLVLRYKQRVEANGIPFPHFLANSAQLSAAQRRRALANPELAQLIAYPDPTGETAAARVDRQRGH